MAQVALVINGRSYRVACDDGQEERVRELGTVRLRAVRVDSREAPVLRQHEPNEPDLLPE